MKFRSLPSCRDWKIRVLSFFIIAFQRNDSQVHEKNISGLWICQEAGRKSTSQRSREIIYNCKFGNINDLRKKQIRSLETEENLWSLLKLRGTLKPFWSPSHNIKYIIVKKEKTQMWYCLLKIMTTCKYIGTW